MSCCREANQVGFYRDRRTVALLSSIMTPVCESWPIAPHVDCVIVDCVDWLTQRQVVSVLRGTEHHSFPVTNDLDTAMRPNEDFHLEVPIAVCRACPLLCAVAEAGLSRLDWDVFSEPTVTDQ